MHLNTRTIKDHFLSLSLNKKLIAIMLFLSASLMSILVILYYQTEKSIFNEFEKQVAELSKGIQVGIKEVTSSGLSDQKLLENYLQKLNTKGVKEISIISNSDKIISSTNPQNIGKWITKAKKELIFKAELGEPVSGEGQIFNVIVPVVAGDKHYGYIHVAVNTEDFSALLRLRIMRRITATALIFGIGLILIIVLAKKYTKPIEDVVQAARNVAAGDLDQELRTERKDEIGELAASFNYMVSKLKEQRDLEERLRKAEHLAGIGQFSMSIAHEIRNPLNFISLSIDHIQEKYKPHEEAREAFNSLVLNIKKEIQRVSRFAESFLEFSRPLELNRQMSDIRKIIEDVLELTQAKAYKENIDIVKKFDPLPKLYVDPEFIKTCFFNIILNAFHAMPLGGKLSVKLARTNASCRMTVSDTGVGLPEEKAAKIFDPFFTTKATGIGLGLALTKRVVEEHGGKVEFSSTQGKGSTVTIDLPITKEI